MSMGYKYNQLLSDHNNFNDNLDGLNNLDGKVVDEILQNIDGNLLSISTLKKYQHSNYQLINHQNICEFVDNILSKRQGQNYQHKDASANKDFGQSIQLVFMNSNDSPIQALQEVNHAYFYHNFLFRDLFLGMITFSIPEIKNFIIPIHMNLKYRISKTITLQKIKKIVYHANIDIFHKDQIMLSSQKNIIVRMKIPSHLCSNLFLKINYLNHHAKII